MLKILIVDDEPEIVRTLKDFFSQKNYGVFVSDNGQSALDMVREHRPHLVFLDIRMPKMDGLAVLRSIRELDKSVKVIMVTAFGTKEIVNEAKRLGAVDFVRKPFTLDYLQNEVIAKVNIQLFEDLRREIEEKNQLIEQLKSLNERVSRNFCQTVLSLATALESRDHYTHGHSERVASYSRLIAEEIKNTQDVQTEERLDDKFLHDLHIEARLHDIGKIAVPDDILNKRGKLTQEEFAQIKKHPVESARILTPLEGIKDNLDVIYSHHERVDGKGYPAGKSDKKIPLRAKIIAIADAFDAMTSDRPYRAAMLPDKAFVELERNKDVQFDASLVDVFIKAYKKTITRKEKEEMPLEV